MGYNVLLIKYINNNNNTVHQIFFLPYNVYYVYTIINIHL